MKTTHGPTGARAWPTVGVRGGAPHLTCTVLTVVCAAAAAWLGCPAIAQAQEQSPSDGYPIRAEGHVGWQDPFGTYGLSLAYDRGGRFSGGLGLGLNGLKKDTLPPMGIFGRARLLRWDWGALVVGTVLSREHDHGEQMVGQDLAFWDWNPGYRATVSLGAEFAHRGWSLRFDAGIGYLLNAPHCYGDRDCDSPQIPSAVQTASQHSRVIPSLTATLGYGFELPALIHSHTAEVPPGYKFPDTALSLSFWSTLIPVLAGTAMLLPTLTHSNDRLALSGAALLALGLSFGPSIGYAYSEEHLRAWGLGALRLAGNLAGVAAIFAGGAVSEQTSKNDPGEMALGVCVIGAVVVSAIYDIATAPNAARRTNARHGLTNLGLAPMPIPGRSATSPGLALVGQF